MKISKIELLKSVVDQILVLHIFNSDIDPDDNTGLDDLTQPDNYEPIELSFSDWSVNSDLLEARTRQVITFSNSVGNIFGYYITRQRNGEILVAHRFSDAPFDVEFGGSQIVVDATVTK